MDWNGLVADQSLGLIRNVRQVRIYRMGLAQLNAFLYNTILKIKIPNEGFHSDFKEEPFLVPKGSFQGTVLKIPICSV